MKKPLKRFMVVGIVLVLFSSICLAETMYVTDLLKLPLRTGPSTEYKILALVESGQQLEVEESLDNWSLVRLANGKEGYVLNRYLVAQPTSAVRLEQLHINHEALKLHADNVLKENTKLKDENRNLKDILQNNELVLKRLDSDYKELKKYTETFAERHSPLQKASEKKLNTIGTRWAVVIGISDYQDSKVPPLRYAASDAQSFYNWLIHDGGRYAPTRVRLLIDQEAKYVNIKEALFDWLKQALEEDVIIIYFAGHGSPDSPDSQKNLYLLPYDVNYDSVATTGFPMWDIETALKRFIRAKKVIVIADACHAGGVGQSFDIARRANRGIPVNPISSGLQNLSNVGDGVCIISASTDNQFSQESKDWGGGHGVFTYFLLKGLKGEADYNNDKRISLGEIVPFLSEHVRRATRNAQSPTVAGRFDPALSIAR